MIKRKYVHPLNRPVRKVDGELNYMSPLDELIPDSQIKVAGFEGPTSNDLIEEFLDEVLSFERPNQEVLDDFAQKHNLDEGQKDELKWRISRSYPNMFATTTDELKWGEAARKKQADDVWANEQMDQQAESLARGEGYVIFTGAGEPYFIEEMEMAGMDINQFDPDAWAVYKSQGGSMQRLSMLTKKQADFNEINQQMRERGYQFMTSDTDDGGVSYKLMDANPDDVGTLTQELGNTYEGYSFNYSPGQGGMSEFSITPSPQFRMQQTMPDMGEIDVTGDGMGMAPKGVGDAGDLGGGARGGGVPTANDIPADAGAMYAGRNYPEFPTETMDTSDSTDGDFNIESDNPEDWPSMYPFDNTDGEEGDKTYPIPPKEEWDKQAQYKVGAGYWDEDDWDADRSEFADPGGESALRAESPSNPRNLPCPTCGEPNRLTPKDVAKRYQCDDCARRDEGYGY